MIKASNDTRTLIRILLIPVLFTVFLYFGKPILVPLLFAILLAMLTAPLCRFLDGKHFSRSVSCMICVLVLLLSGFALAWLLISQLFVFLKDIDLIKERAAGIIGGIMNKIELWFNIPSEKQQDLLQQQMTVIESTLQTEFGKIFGHITNTLVDTGMVLIFLFLLLFHKEKYESFFLKLFAGEERKEVKDILDEITSVSQKYLTGRILSMISIFILYVIALSIIGIKNAVLLSVIASILTIVPYIGPLVGGLFPVLTALITYDTIQPAIWVFIAFLLIQVIDDYLVEPNVLGGEVNLTALSTIIAIILGGMLWGIAGMILFIPMLSIAKIIFDKVDHLHPYGFLIGDESSRPSERIFSFFKRVFKRHS